VSSQTAAGPHAAKRPRTIAAGPYGHPFHPILVTVPIGAWTAALVFDLVALLGSDEATFGEGAQWLTAIGIVGAVAAALVGLMDLGTIPRGTEAFGTAIAHMVLNSAALVLFTISFVLRWKADDLPVSAFVLSLVGLGLLGASGWLGGKLAYTYGVRVADEGTQAEAFR
jgi:uncharacterized membrane protein